MILYNQSGISLSPDIKEFSDDYYWYDRYDILSLR